jgi:hypothetical protein
MTAAVNVDAGGILQDIGRFGTYQKFLCVVVVGTINGLCAMSFATQLFSLATSDHWCWNSDVAALEEQLPLAREDTKKFSIPMVSTGESKTTMLSLYTRFIIVIFQACLKNRRRGIFFMHYHEVHKMLKNSTILTGLSIGSQHIIRQFIGFYWVYSYLTPVRKVCRS